MEQTAVEFHEDSALIEQLGGPAAIARRLGYEQPAGTRRVQNWKYRGIPELVLLKNPDIFGPAPSEKPEAERAA